MRAELRGRFLGRGQRVGVLKAESIWWYVVRPQDVPWADRFPICELGRLVGQYVRYPVPGPGSTWFAFHLSYRRCHQDRYARAINRSSCQCGYCFARSYLGFRTGVGGVTCGYWLVAAFTVCVPGFVVRTVVLTTNVNGHLKSLAGSGAGYVVGMGKACLVSHLLSRLSSLGLRHVVLIVNCRKRGLHARVRGRDEGAPVRCVCGPICGGAGGVCSLCLTGRRLRGRSALLVRSSLVFRSALFRGVLGGPCPGLTLMTGCRP